MVGIYFLKHKEEVVYVGQSRKIETRLKQHSVSDKTYDSFTAFECRESLLNETEEAYILRYNPRYNIKKSEITTNKKKIKKKNVRAKEKHIIVNEHTHAMVKRYAKEEGRTMASFLKELFIRSKEDFKKEGLSNEKNSNENS